MCLLQSNVKINLLSMLLQTKYEGRFSKCSGKPFANFMPNEQQSAAKYKKLC